MNIWKKNLIDYMIAKSKPRDLIIYTTHINIQLIAILQKVKDEIETFQDFTVDMRRKRFNETITFPLRAADFTLLYDNENLIGFNFEWIQNEDNTGLNLRIQITNFCHQRFDAQLKADMGIEPDWLKDCVWCEVVTRTITDANNITEELVAGFVIDVFQKSTQHYLV